MKIKNTIILLTIGLSLGACQTTKNTTTSNWKTD